MDEKVRKVINVVGTPTSVEREVNNYLKEGYHLGSSLLPWQEPNTYVQLFVQQVILSEE